MYIASIWCRRKAGKFRWFKQLAALVGFLKGPKNLINLLLSFQIIKIIFMKSWIGKWFHCALPDVDATITLYKFF